MDDAELADAGGTRLQARDQVGIQLDRRELAVPISTEMLSRTRTPTTVVARSRVIRRLSATASPMSRADARADARELYRCDLLVATVSNRPIMIP